MAASAAAWLVDWRFQAPIRKMATVRTDRAACLLMRRPSSLTQSNSFIKPYTSRARLARKAGRVTVRGPKFEVFGTSNPELRTSRRACRAHLACLAHAHIRDAAGMKSAWAQ